MSVEGVYCKWCGTFITGGGLFCTSCGKEVEKYNTAVRTASHPRPTSAKGAETEQPTGPVAKLVEVVGRIIALILALVVALVGLALPVLVVLALFLGPGDTWDMVREWVPGGGNTNAACEGFDDWYQESADRSQQIIVMMEDFETDSATNSSSILSMARETDALAAEQRNSSPPNEAIALNGMMVKTFEVSADALRAVADGDQGRLQSLTREAERMTRQFDAEEKRVFNVCG